MKVGRLRARWWHGALAVGALALGALAVASAHVSVAAVDLMAKQVSGDPASPDDPAWSSVTAKIIKTSSRPTDGGHGGLASEPDIKVKAAFNSEYVYMYFEWEDDSFSNVHSYWTFDGDNWSPSGVNVNEDRLYLMWPVVDGPGREGKTFAQAGCAMTCHKIASKKLVETPQTMDDCGACHSNAGNAVEDFKHTWALPGMSCSACHTGSVDRTENTEADMAAPTGTTLDIWHWKAGRASNIGYADDQVSASMDSRGNDASPGLDFDNKLASGVGPKYVWPLDAEGSASTGDVEDIVRKSGLGVMAELTADGKTLKATGAPVPAGTTVRMKVMNDVDAAAKNKDIMSQQEYDSAEGKWRVVLKRKLITTDPKDRQLNLDGPNPFSIAVTDNSHIKHAGNAGPHILRFPARITAGVAPTVIDYGQTAAVTGSYTGASGTGVAGELSLRSLQTNKSWAAMRTLSTGLGGAYVSTVTPTKSMVMRVQDLSGRTVSQQVQVGVRMQAYLSADRSTVKRNKSVKITGSVAPAHRGHPAQIQFRKAGTSTWKTLKAVKLGSNSMFTWYWKPPVKGTYQLRLVAPGHWDGSLKIWEHMSDVSAVRAVTVN